MRQRKGSELLESVADHGPDITGKVHRTASHKPSFPSRFFSASVFASRIPFVSADSGEDFSNNLFSDLAPILALFGEQVT